MTNPEPHPVNSPAYLDPDAVEDLLHRLAISEREVTAGTVRRYEYPTPHFRFELRVPVEKLNGKNGPRKRIDWE